MSYDPNRYYDLLESRIPLIQARNKILDTFWWWIPTNMKKVDAIDEELEKIDYEIYLERKKMVDVKNSTSQDPGRQSDQEEDC